MDLSLGCRDELTGGGGGGGGKADRLLEERVGLSDAEWYSCEGLDLRAEFCLGSFGLSKLGSFSSTLDLSLLSPLGGLVSRSR